MTVALPINARTCSIISRIIWQRSAIASLVP